MKNKWVWWLSPVLVIAAAGGIGAAEQLAFNPVSSKVVESRLEKCERDNKDREAVLVRLFREAGCDGERLTEQVVKGEKLPNVVCVLPGSTGLRVIVGAHYDHVSEGDGVADNWSGASLLPSLYEGIRGQPRKHTYIFIGFSGEEDGEVGSHFYARHMDKEEVLQTQAMVNLDTLGLGPTQVWVSASDKALTRFLFYIAKALGLPAGGSNMENVGRSDNEQFSERGIPTITIHSYTQAAENAGILHSKKDNLSAIQPDDYYQSYRLLCAYLAYLDDAAGIKAEKH